MLHLCFCDDFFERNRKVFEDDNRDRTAVVQLVLQFARRVQRIHIDNHEARAQHGENGHGILQDIGHHQRDAVSSLQALCL